jgi:arylsulfatase
MEFATDGPGLGIGGTVRLYIDGSAVGHERVENTVPLIFSGDETCEIGSDAGTQVSAEYPAHDNAFTGKLRWVQIDVDPHSSDHQVDPEDRMRIIMSRQ